MDVFADSRPERPDEVPQLAQGSSGTTVELFLLAQGYSRSSFSGDISSHTDIAVGEYSKERRVQAARTERGTNRTTQKADLAFRLRTSQRLVLVEAKAIGVQVDAYKRVKECCQKAHVWKANPALNDPVVVAVIAGFLKEVNLQELAEAGVFHVWEHDIEGLSEHM
jgi:hypothetical protein